MADLNDLLGPLTKRDIEEMLEELEQLERNEEEEHSKFDVPLPLENPESMRPKGRGREK